MRDGTVTLAQAHVIRRALDALPARVDADTVALAEAHARRARPRSSGPRSSAASGRRILDVVAPEIAEQAEADRLADLEANAADQTRLTMRRHGDGTTRISGRVSDALATRFATYLEAFANPRAPRRTADDRAAADRNAADPVARLPYPKRLGQAFGQFLEAIDPTRLPIHGGDATTVIVTIPLASLRAELGAADLIGGGLVPGDDLTGDRITASPGPPARVHREDPPRRPRRHSLPLDLGRAKRLFTPAQRKALLIRDQHLPRRRLRHPRHLVRRPPPRPLAHRRPHRPRQRASCSAATTTTASTTPATAPTASPTATSGSTDAPRPTPRSDKSVRSSA